jgi:hypothetical protein
MPVRTHDARNLPEFRYNDGERVFGHVGDVHLDMKHSRRVKLSHNSSRQHVKILKSLKDARSHPYASARSYNTFNARSRRGRPMHTIPEQLPIDPVVTIPTVGKLLRTTKRTAGKAGHLLETLSVLTETTGKQHDRTYAYMGYLEMLCVETEVDLG